ncbi:parkin co-regulated protein-domain-containing protein [Pelagophyceae sp. CCMP2097]|nr:parkin co-regulated protein-domain-containing protein [Pelagophyceae sp. CCMP2097]
MAALLAQRGDGGTAPFARGGAWASAPATSARGVSRLDEAARPAAHGVERRLRGARDLAAHRGAVKSLMRTDYDAGLLPLRIVYKDVDGVNRRTVAWLIDDLSRLDFRHYLPMFVGAFGEAREPYGFIAIEAALDLVQAAGAAHRALALAPLVSPQLKQALRSKDADEARRALRFLEAFATCDAKSRGGLGLVVRTLPVKSFASAVSHAAANHAALRPHANLVLRALEEHGGPVAAEQIKAGARTYESLPA